MKLLFLVLLFFLPLQFAPVLVTISGKKTLRRLTPEHANKLDQFYFSLMSSHLCFHVKVILMTSIYGSLHDMR